MTWEEIKPVAEAILGEDCWEMTLNDLAFHAAVYGFDRVSDMIRAIEEIAEKSK